MVRWRLQRKEFGPEYVHVTGQQYTVADALSRMKLQRNESDLQEVPEVIWLKQPWLKPTTELHKQSHVTATVMAILTRNEVDMKEDEVIQ